MSFVNDIINSPATSKEERQACLKRVHADPGHPDPERTTASFWIKHGRSAIANVRSETLPTTADVVIVGSGMTGTSVAHHLLSSAATKGTKPRVIMVDARPICNGATGRNGGHILETVEDYVALKDTYGAAAAAKITRFRLAHLNAIMETAQKYGLVEEAQVRKVQFLSIYDTETPWQETKKVLTEFREDIPEDLRDFGFLEGPELKAKCHLPTAVGALYGPAGAMWPYRLVTGILAELSKLYGDHFSIETNTPVSKVTAHGNGYIVHTQRGSIDCKHVVHATNGHGCHLVPGLSGKLYPLRGQMSAQQPPENVPNQAYKHSWLVNYSGGYDYLTQLPVTESVSQGEMMLGGAWAKTYGGGIREIGIARDDELNLGAKAYLEHALEGIFGQDSYPDSESPVKMMWTGTMGFTYDGLPWVGRIPESVAQRQTSSTPTSQEHCEKGGEWISAGYNGEGMVNAFLCGRALAGMIEAADEDRWETGLSEILAWFPEDMLISEQRLKESGLPPPDSEAAKEPIRGEKIVPVIHTSNLIAEVPV